MSLSFVLAQNHLNLYSNKWMKRDPLLQYQYMPDQVKFDTGKRFEKQIIP